MLVGRRRNEIVVLARTTNLLRTTALACAELGVKISAPEPVFEPHGARGALEAYLRVCAAPAQAQPDDIALVCRAPGRGPPFGTEERVAMCLHGGLTFAESLVGVPANDRQRVRLEDAGRILDALPAISDAQRFIAYLRGRGGLDEYFTAYEQAFGATEKIELEVLEQAQRDASGKTVAGYGELVRARSDALRAIRDDVNGIELTTIHRAKGRQWPEVHLFGCEEAQLPHQRALEVGEQERAAGEGLEAERRLAYVAFTRAQQTLTIHTTETAASRFLSEAGLAPTRPYGSSAPVVLASGPRPPRLPKRVGKGPVAGVLGQAQRIGLAYGLRTAPSRTVALEAAAVAVEERLIGPSTASARMSVAGLLEAIEDLTSSERDAVLRAAHAGGREELVVCVGKSARRNLVRALRRLASGSRGLPENASDIGPARVRVLPPDGELDASILRLVADHPGQLGRATVAQILWGSEGRMVKAEFGRLREFGSYREVPHAHVRKRVARLIDGGQIESRGANPPRLWVR